MNQKVQQQKTSFGLLRMHYVTLTGFLQHYIVTAKSNRAEMHSSERNTTLL